MHITEKEIFGSIFLCFQHGDVIYCNQKNVKKGDYE